MFIIIVELSSYQDEQFVSSTVEYGITDNQNIGVHFLYKEDKFLNEKNISTDASMYYNFSTCEGIKLKNGIMFTSFTKYHTRQNYGYVCDNSVYEQLGIAKIINFGKENKNSITTQISYFWDRSLSNKKYEISGISFSAWLDV